MNILKSEYYKNMLYWSDRLETTVNFSKTYLYSDDTLIDLVDNELDGLLSNLKHYVFAVTCDWSQE